MSIIADTRLGPYEIISWIARIYAALNEKEWALAWLERGFAAGAIGAFIKDDPVWDLVRSDPRFADLFRRMGIEKN